jgi:hypothetical protein
MLNNTIHIFLIINLCLCGRFTILDVEGVGEISYEDVTAEVIEESDDDSDDDSDTFDAFDV